MHDFRNVDNHHPLLHFINKNSSLVHTLWNEEKLVALLVYSSFVRVAISGFRNISVFTSSGSILCSNEEWFRNHSAFTTAQHSNSINDVTRLVVTEHVRNKYSLRESILLQASHVFSSTNLNQGTAVNCTYRNQSVHLYRKGGFIVNI